MEAKAKPPGRVYEIVTEKIVAALDKGTVPWKQPWVNLGQGGHKNLESKRSYRGINQLLLQISEYEQPWWITLPGANRLGGQIAKGESPTIVVWTKNVRVKDKEAEEPDATKTIWMLRYYKVWNVEQTIGLEERIPEPPESDPDWSPVEQFGKLVEGYPSPAPSIKHIGDEAFYVESKDVVCTPKPEQFSTAANYYAAFAHELSHSTGHEKRLDRDLDGQMGSESYSKEELVAEIGAAMLLAEAGIEPLYDLTASYVDHWRERLTDDPRLIVTAAAQAQRSCDYIAGRDQEDTDGRD